jgi:hypothetical protein
VNGLWKAGYSVDLFLFRFNMQIQDVDRNDIQIYDYSSEKLDQYLHADIPVIAFHYPSFIKSVKETGCGV